MKEIKSVSGINNKGGDPSLKRIGNFIKEARLSKNQSIEELASDLKIGAHQLEAIEEGNEEKLPEKVFIKACLLYTSPSPRDGLLSRMPSSA